MRQEAPGRRTGTAEALRFTGVPGLLLLCAEWAVGTTGNRARTQKRPSWFVLGVGVGF